MPKLSHRSSHKRVIILLSVRKDWRSTFITQLRDAIEKKELLGYARILYPQPSLEKKWKRKDK